MVRIPQYSFGLTKKRNYNGDSRYSSTVEGLQGTKLGVFGGFLTLKASGAEIRRLWVFGFRVRGLRAFEFQSVFRQRVLKASGALGSFQGSILSIQATG